MSSEHSIISQILDDRLADYQKHNLKPEMFIGKPREAIEFILEHVSKYGQVPDKTTIEQKFGPTFTLKAPEPFAYYAKLLRDRHITNVMGEEMTEATKAMSEGELDASIDFIKSALSKAEAIRMEERDFLNLGAVAEDYYAGVMDLCAGRGEAGYEMPWSILNDCAGGVRKGELWIFVGSLKMGKTFLMTFLSSHFFLRGLKVLFVTQEMRVERIATRFFATHFQLPYDGVLRGQLTLDQKEEYRKRVDTFKDEGKTPDLVGTGTVQRPQDVELLMAEVSPDIVIIDAIYRMRSNDWTPKLSRWENVAQVVDELQKLAIRRNVPIICSTQFNRKQKKDTKEATTANIGLAWEIPQNADMVLGVLRPDDLRGNDLCIIGMMEGRDAADYKDIVIRWDMETMDFSQIGYMKDGVVVPVSPGESTRKRVGPDDTAVQAPPDQYDDEDKAPISVQGGLFGGGKEEEASPPSAEPEASEQMPEECAPSSLSGPPRQSNSGGAPSGPDEDPDEGEEGEDEDSGSEIGGISEESLADDSDEGGGTDSLPFKPKSSRNKKRPAEGDLPNTDIEKG